MIDPCLRIQVKMTINRVLFDSPDSHHKLDNVFVCVSVFLSRYFMSPVTVCETRYLSLRDDVEGAPLLSLPDDVLSFVIVFLMRRERG